MNQLIDLQSINNNNNLNYFNLNHHYQLPSINIMSTPLQSSESNQDQPQIVLTPAALSAGQCTYLNDANKAFDDVVFDILKVDPDDIAGQMTLIDLPLFKAIEPDELISCKWMSREKLVKAPNIVQFTRRFNQTTFWCQKEILNCKRIETRAKMLTHFIKICKRLNELHSFNSLMAIIVALKSAPIYRLKKTWSHVSKRDLATFERLADLMFDTSDNKRKIRDMHMNCKLPCIPFLGLFLTDLIHIDIAHPHNSFDNPQRRNQMNNICRLVSEYQQSNYQDLTSISCLCELNSSETCLTPNCQCALHHGNGYAGGLINSDGTIYINEIKYVKNYLNSFLYIEELQKFKEDENYRDSLELEPDPEVISHLPEKQTSPLSTSSPSKQNLENNLIKPVINLNNVNSNNNNKLVNPLDDSLVIDNNLIHFNLNEFNELSKEEQKKILNNVKLTDPPSNLLKELLKHRHQNTTLTNKPSLRHKFSCYSSSTADLDDDEDLAEASLDDSSYINELTPVKNNTQLDRLGLTPSTGRNLSTDFGIDQLDSSETSSLQCPNGQIILFESPIKRKCIIKNFRKPRFSQWKSYWLQLVGGNLLIYYPAKTSLIFSKDSRRSSVISSEDLNSTESLKNQVQNKKVFYNKNPCKMHPIANWMVVNLFDDRKEQEENKSADLSTCEKY
ncbi:unnamed protein product, partial [Brachionus calyciflorus]